VSPENGEMNGTYNYFLYLINFEVLDVLGCSMTDGESHWAFAQMVWGSWCRMPEAWLTWSIGASILASGRLYI